LTWVAKSGAGAFDQKFGTGKKNCAKAEQPDRLSEIRMGRRETCQMTDEARRTRRSVRKNQPSEAGNDSKARKPAWGRVCKRLSANKKRKRGRGAVERIEEAKILTNHMQGCQL